MELWKALIATGIILIVGGWLVWSFDHIVQEGKSASTRWVGKIGMILGGLALLIAPWTAVQW